MRVKINFVFFVYFGNTAIFASIEERSTVTKSGARDFAEVRYQPGFVDQSLLIEPILDDQSRILIVAPRRSGKSVNMSMLKRFLEILPDEKAVQANRKLFEGLEIEKRESIMEEHFGKYPVIYLDLKTDEPVRTGTAAFELVRDVIHRAYQSHAYLRTSDKLEDVQKAFVEKWLDDDKYRTIATTRETIFVAFLNLPKYLYKHFDQQVFVLVDEYDSIWYNYVKDNNGLKYIPKDDEKKLLRYIRLFTDSLEKLLVNNEYVLRGILTGIYSLRPIAYVWTYGSELQYTILYKCPENPRYSKFYGNYSSV